MSVRDERCRKLDEWLAKHNAMCMWSKHMRNPSCNINAYLINGQMILVQEIGEGWNLYVSPCESNEIDTTLKAAEIMLGLVALTAVPSATGEG